MTEFPSTFSNHNTSQRKDSLIQLQNLWERNSVPAPIQSLQNIIFQKNTKNSMIYFNDTTNQRTTNVSTTKIILKRHFKIISAINTN